MPRTIGNCEQIISYACEVQVIFSLENIKLNKLLETFHSQPEKVPKSVQTNSNKWSTPIKHIQ